MGVAVADDDFAGSDEDGDRDHYKERLKKEARARAAAASAESGGDDSDESDDEDFDPNAKQRKNSDASNASGDSSSPDEEYDSDARSSDAEEGSGSEEEVDGETKTKKAKKTPKKRAGSPTASKRKTNKAKKDPNAPKRAQSAYMLWMNENRKTLAKPGMSVVDVAREAGAQWKAIDAEVKTVGKLSDALTILQKYEALAAKDKQRAEREMAEYKASGGGVDDADSAEPKKSAKSNVLDTNLLQVSEKGCHIVEVKERDGQSDKGEEQGVRVVEQRVERRRGDGHHRGGEAEEAQEEEEQQRGGGGGQRLMCH